jgi:hypothetical protein
MEIFNKILKDIKSTPKKYTTFLGGILFMFSLGSIGLIGSKIYLSILIIQKLFNLFKRYESILFKLFKRKI